MTPQTPPPRPSSPEISPEAYKPLRKSCWSRIAAVILAPVLLLSGLAMALIVPHWPYSEHILIPAMQDAFKTKVIFQSFHRYYFPHPGCDAELVTLTLPQNGSGDRTVVTIQHIAITGRYSDLLVDPKHFAHIRLDGLYVRIPPGSERRPYESSEPENEAQLSQVSLGSVTAHDAVVEFKSATHTNPLKFEIHKLLVENIAAGKPMSYQVSMGLSEPPGELESQGAFGPWQSGHPGQIPLRGKVTLTDAKLDTYHGIAGTVQSQDDFSGVLDHINIEGEARTAEFQVKTAKHPVALSTQFRLLVNGIEGEVQLQDVIARVGHTTAHARGSIEKNHATGRRETLVDFTIQDGRAEDLLWLFNNDTKPPMTGIANFAAHVHVPQFVPDFLENLELKGRFSVTEGHFQKSTQAKANRLSARASGKKPTNPDDPPEVVVERLASDVKMQKAVATFPNFFFGIPNAHARMHGTYNFLKHEVDLHGDLWTQAKISQDTSGFKAALMKPLDPLFKRKHAGARIPVVMDGPISHPHFGTDIVPKK